MNDRRAGNGHKPLIKEMTPGEEVLQGPQDFRLFRTKRIIVHPAIIASFLQMDGTHTLKCEGWPEGAIVLATQILTDAQVVLVIHRDDFPIVRSLDEAPIVQIKWQTYDVLESQPHVVETEAAGEG